MLAASNTGESMLRALLVPLFALALSGCGEPCDSTRVCAVNHDDNSVCDGTSFRACDATDVNLRLKCANGLSAVCTPTGWTFQ